jgi:dihydroorotate dehydrogenase
MRSRLPAHIPLVGVGGILSGADAAGKMTAGAQLVQFYTGLIYRGPALIGECVQALRHRRDGVRG